MASEQFPKTAVEQMNIDVDIALRDFENNRAQMTPEELLEYWNHLRSFQMEMHKNISDDRLQRGWGDVLTKIEYGIIAAEQAIRKCGVTFYMRMLRASAAVTTEIGMGRTVAAIIAIHELSSVLVGNPTMSLEEEKEAIDFFKEYGVFVSDAGLDIDEKNALGDGLREFLRYLSDQKNAQYQAKEGDEVDHEQQRRDAIKKLSLALSSVKLSDEDRKIVIRFLAYEGLRI